ncbi:site-specific DNA-methyltransferase [Listeria monocytogenes]|uniref:site-specific DNA-methyltransferase n=1 Tax=Listeria innocua TaxID=1642 RepID=UPI0022717337|nr:site-specific DNA-methyltransferase [Listeria innocua]EIZ2538863.1 site-specific DNA-methyltransferase [Listeria monocytogenes]
MSENIFNDRPHKNEKDDSIAYLKTLIDKARDEAREDDIPKLEKLIKMLNTKKYGLVWEEHAEKVEEEMKTKIPVFIEDESKKINDNTDSEDYSFLLEGDNLHSLHLLKKTHLGKIDVIYIDPPYNTGAKDWKYNNSFVDDTDSFRHSKWISFMQRRLMIAKNLLSEKGIIIVAIDHYELANLIELMDEEFGEKNRIGIVSVVHKPEGRNQEKFFGTSNEFALFYAREKSKASFRQVLINNNPEDYDKSDSIGVYKLKNFIRMSDGKYATKDAKPNFWYPIYISKDLREYSFSEKEGFRPVYPITSSGIERTWKTLPKSFVKYWDEGNIEVVENEGGISIFEKQRPNEVIKTHWLKTEYHAYHHGTKVLTELLGEKRFDFPKSVTLIKDILKLTSYKESIILDFFAGSGTTGQAVTELNTEDGGTRKFILATNSENNIAEEVTYERMKHVSTGTKKYEAHPLNLKYFKTDFVIKEEFPDVSLEYELLKYVTPLVELEFGIDITNPKVQIVLNEEQLESLIDNKQLISNSTIFMHPDVFRDDKQNQILQDLQIRVQEIPNYFFGTELWAK